MAWGALPLNLRRRRDGRMGTCTALHEPTFGWVIGWAEPRKLGSDAAATESIHDARGRAAQNIRRSWAADLSPTRPADRIGSLHRVETDRRGQDVCENEPQRVRDPQAGSCGTFGS